MVTSFVSDRGQGSSERPWLGQIVVRVWDVVRAKLVLSARYRICGRHRNTKLDEKNVLVTEVARKALDKK